MMLSLPLCELQAAPSCQPVSIPDLDSSVTSLAQLTHASAHKVYHEDEKNGLGLSELAFGTLEITSLTSSGLVH